MSLPHLHVPFENVLRKNRVGHCGWWGAAATDSRSSLQQVAKSKQHWNLTLSSYENISATWLITNAVVVLDKYFAFSIVHSRGVAQLKMVSLHGKHNMLYKTVVLLLQHWNKTWFLLVQLLCNMISLKPKVKTQRVATFVYTCMICVFSLCGLILVT